MATYNSGHGTGAGLPSGAGPSSHGIALGQSMPSSAVAIDVFDQEMNFDDSLLDGVHGLAPLPFNQSYDFDSFNTFEDPFSYSARPTFDPPVDNEPFNEESPAQELDNKLLGFSAPLFKAQFLDSGGAFAETSLSAELLGMFFVAEDVFGGETTGRPLELTCYRRNLWQCSGQITLPRHVSHVLDEQGQQLPIIELAASISAIESIEGKATEIITIPWKSANGEDANSTATKTPTAPANISLDLSTGQELDHNRISLTVIWKRLQFKHATANNGRRKGLQQHYVVQINLLGKLKNGQFITVAEIQSGPVIVRGRSPRNFDSRKDLPLSADKKAAPATERRGTSASSSGADAPTGGANNAALSGFKTEKGISSLNDWATTPSPYEQASPHPTKKVAMTLSPSASRPPVPAWSPEIAQSGPATPRHSSVQQRGSAPLPPSVPINLSLSEDERSPNRSNSDCTSPQFTKTTTGNQSLAKTPDDDEEELYEYFPLSLDDWMAPVDAIYRPHVVHHTIVPPDLQAQHVRSRTKRYFSSD
ncbi:acid phosphatase [Coniella lustricola]|uniref:Acid phosphatase n=1 Tax=Coniella lustricola TaxID=2025994 RepID=A0A2T3A1H4_9PEZI|nr:acid phosphatase [Coniella lustricola]